VPFLNEARQRVQQLVQDNATTILTAGGVVGTVATAVLAGRAGYKAAELIILEEGARIAAAKDKAPLGDPVPEIEPISKIDKVKLVGLHFAPPVLTGVATIGSIVMANRMSAQKAAALAAAYGVSQNQLQEYKAKVEEKLGINKADKLRTEIQQDRVNEKPPSSKDIVIIGAGEVLCFDSWSGRYFKSTVEAIRKAENAVSQEIAKNQNAPLSVFYDALDLKPVVMGDELGWNLGHQCSIHLDAVLAREQEPCMTIEFENYPIQDYQEVRGRGWS
jgi:hypothetical protein